MTQYKYEFLQKSDASIASNKEPNGFRPLSLGRMSNGAYVLASETCTLDIVSAKFIRDIEPGEIIVINNEGYKIEHYAKNIQHAVC